MPGKVAMYLEGEVLAGVGSEGWWPGPTTDYTEANSLHPATTHPLTGLVRQWDLSTTPPCYDVNIRILILTTTFNTEVGFLML